VDSGIGLSTACRTGPIPEGKAGYGKLLPYLALAG
jgi:hypothetical protein